MKHVFGLWGEARDLERPQVGFEQGPSHCEARVVTTTQHHRAACSSIHLFIDLSDLGIGLVQVVRDLYKCGVAPACCDLEESFCDALCGREWTDPTVMLGET